MSSSATFTIFGILLWRYRKKSYDGQIFWLYVTLYAVARFALEFLRGDEDRGFVFGHLLSTSPVHCGACACGCGAGERSGGILTEAHPR